MGTIWNRIRHGRPARFEPETPEAPRIPKAPPKPGLRAVDITPYPSEPLATNGTTTAVFSMSMSQVLYAIPDLIPAQLFQDFGDSVGAALDVAGDVAGTVADIAGDLGDS